MATDKKPENRKEGSEAPESSTSDSAATILSELDTGQASLLHWLFPCRPQDKDRSYRECSCKLLPYLAVVCATYLPLSVVALLTLPSVFKRSDEIWLPFAFDLNTMWMFTVFLPVLVLFIVTDRRLLSEAVSQLAGNAILVIDAEKAEGIRTTWEAKFRAVNITAQVVGVVTGLTLAVSNALAYSTARGFWAAPGGHLNASGWAFLYCIFLFYAFISVFALRAIATMRFLRSLVRQSEIEVVPFHPDRCGGLKPVGKIGLRNQYLLTIAGINIVLLVVGSLVIEVGTGLYGLIAVALVAYLILGPLVFLGPLLAFRNGMLRTRNELIDDIAHRLRGEFETIQEQLRTGTITKEAEDSLDRLRKVGDLARRLPVWPFDTATLRKFLTAYLLPAIGVAYPFVRDLIERLIESMGP